MGAVALRTKPSPQAPPGITALVTLPGWTQTCCDAAPAFTHPASILQSSFAAGGVCAHWFLSEPPMAFRG